VHCVVTLWSSSRLGFSLRRYGCHCSMDKDARNTFMYMIKYALKAHGSSYVETRSSLSPFVTTTSAAKCAVCSMMDLKERALHPRFPPLPPNNLHLNTRTACVSAAPPPAGDGWCHQKCNVQTADSRYGAARCAPPQKLTRARRSQSGRARYNIMSQ
jgi:hypothetical protein